MAVSRAQDSAPNGVPRSEDMIAPFYTPGRVRVTYGTPLDLSEWRAQRRTPELLQELTDSLMRKLADLGGVKYEPDEEKSVT